MRVAQAELTRVSRATTVGQLTSSIAHEINQPLMSIVANAGASLRWLNRDPARLDKARLGLEEIVSEGERAGRSSAACNPLPASRIRFCPHRSAPSGAAHHHPVPQRAGAATHQRQLCPGGRRQLYCGDSVQIQQVLLNLVMNAIEAMAEIADRPGTLVLSTSNPEGGGITFEMADSGTGIEPGLTERIFDSFYSTKAQGMGVGLTISYSIIERHRGKLTALASRMARFAFTLPLAASMA
jgi:C4-dicarboxylate-specific signal transduction histidine kinase